MTDKPAMRARAMAARARGGDQAALDARLGAALAPLSWRLSAGELARQVELLDPVLLVEEDETHAAVQELRRRLVQP